MAPRDKLKRATFHDYMRGHCTKDQYFHKPIWKAHKENIDLRGDFMERALLANGRETERPWMNQVKFVTYNVQPEKVIEKTKY
jgi:hypothetical protein